MLGVRVFERLGFQFLDFHRFSSLGSVNHIPRWYISPSSALEIPAAPQKIPEKKKKKRKLRQLPSC